VSFDNVCKVLAEKYPADFVRWLIAEESTNVKVLKTELSLEPIRADSVTFLQTANQILHIEFQTLTQSNPAIPFRMLDYSVRLKRQYKCPVVQVVIFLQQTDDEIGKIRQHILRF
jgi:predicted transposase YdaD